MHVHVVHVPSGRELGIVSLKTRPVHLAFDETGIRRLGRQKRGLALLRKGNNVVVTDYGLSEPVTLSEQPLEPANAYSWLQHQDLRVGERFLLRWETDQGVLGALTAGQIATVVVLAMLLIGLLTMVGFLARPEPLTTSESISNAAEAPASPLQSPMAMATATHALPTLQPVGGTPSPTVTVDPLDSQAGNATIAAMQTGAAATAVATIAATPIPCTVLAPKPDAWDLRLSAAVTPACIRRGDSYYRLAEAKWLDAEELDGFHHLFVDVVDGNGNRLYGTSFVMRWQDGECRRYIRGIATPIDHGEHCPMFAPAGSYSVMVDGLPSEIVQGLGLGAVQANVPGWRYLTSFYLRFELATFSAN